MNSSPLQMWPFGKKAKARRQQKRNIRKFQEKTEVRDDKTYDKPVTEYVDFSKLSNEELEEMRNR